MVFLDEINNRELAILFWSAVFIVTSLLSDKRGAIVRAFLGVVRALCNKKIISYIIMSALYSAACVVLISMIGIWSHDNVKDTLVWYFIVGLYPLFRYRDMQEDVWASLKRLAVDGLGFSAIIGFVANFYTFQLWFEFIVFVPISIFMAIFIAVVESDKSVTIEIRQVMNGVMVIIGLSMFVYSLYAILCDLSSFASKETFYSFVCPVMLTVMYLPFLYLFVLLVVYESVFTTINANIHDQYLARKMKWYAIIRYKFSARLLARWNKWIWQIRNFEDAIKSIDEIFAMAKREKAQLPIDLSEGWSPYTSRLFLEDFKIKTGNYDLRYDDVWGASSPAIHVCGCGCLVKSKYSVEGNSNAVKELALVTDVYREVDAPDGHEIMVQMSRILFEKAFSTPLPSEIEESLLHGVDKEYLVGEFLVSVRKTDWKVKGYSIEFVIKCCGAKD